MAKYFGETFSTVHSESISECCGFGEFADCVGQSSNFLDRQQVASFFRDDNFASAVDVVADDRFAGDQALWKNSGESFPLAGVCDDVRCTDQFRNPLWGNETCQNEMIGQPEF